MSTKSITRDATVRPHPYVQATDRRCCTWSEQELAQIVNHAAGGVCALDVNCIILRVNQSYLAMTGHEGDDVVGRKCHEIFPGPNCHTDLCTVHRIRQGETQVSDEVIKIGRGGGRIPCLVAAFPIRDRDGCLIGVIESFRDISVLESARAELERQNEELTAHREMLHRKNIALQEVLDSYDRERHAVVEQIRMQIEQIAIPLTTRLLQRSDPNLRPLITLLRGALETIGAPSGSRRQTPMGKLSPREIEVCHMIRQGFSTKDIASVLCIAAGTVEQQRKSIRRKLGIKGRPEKLTAYLTHTKADS